MQARPRIIPHLWFDKEALEAAEFYTSLFPQSRTLHVGTIHDTPSGDTDTVVFELAGQTFQAISAGPSFKFNPSISFIVNFDPSRDEQARARLDEAWQALQDGGQVLMPLDEYPFSKRYGWVQDRYGVSWQMILSNPEGDPRPFLVPCLLFTDGNRGRAREAGEFYRSVFPDSEVGQLEFSPPEESGGGADELVMFSDFRLGDTWFAAMDSPIEHGFGFNEAISFIVECRSQQEVDHYWEELSADGGEKGPCGWLKDRYGLCWQVVPAELFGMLEDPDEEKVARVTQAFLSMSKLDIEELRRAYSGG